MALMTGALPTPPNRLAAAIPFLSTTRVLGAPPSYAVVPPKLSMWLNDTYGDCVTAEEAFKAAAWSSALGLGETFIPDASVKAWARDHRVLNGAVIEDVLRWRTRDALNAEDGKGYTNGPYNSVDYANDATLSGAIYQGKAIKIGVAHGALSRALNQTGGRSGWHVVGAGRDRGLDHCVALCGYGAASDLYEALKVPLPAGLSPSTHGYLLFTWGTIGFIDAQSMVNITGEAWIRIPGTPEQAVPAPEPLPVPTPGPTPSPVTPPSDYPMSGTYSRQQQVGVYLVNTSVTWTATLNDPPPSA